MSRRKSPSALQELKGKKKIQYILDYYKLPLILIGILIYAVCWITVRNWNQKENILYVGLVNVAPPEEMLMDLSDGYMDEREISKSDYAVYLYQNLFLSADADSEYHPYTYATRMKILGAIEAQHLDLVLMNQEAFDAFSQNGYLEDFQNYYDHPESFDQAPGQKGSREVSSQSTEYGELFDTIKESLQKNIRIEEDNSMEMLLGEEDQYRSVTTEGLYGLDLTSVSERIRKEALSDKVYLGILANSPRKDEALRYLCYLI